MKSSSVEQLILELFAQHSTEEARMFTSRLALALLLPFAAWSGEATSVLGYWGDGSGIHRGDPPVRWDSDTGLGILWRARFFPCHR